MSLTVTSTGNGGNFSPIPEGTYLGVCNMLIDLGVQENATFKSKSRKVLIGWEIPEETIEIEGKQVPRTISKRYTASLNESANLRQDLAAWRGRDFTELELAGFNLRNIVGCSCLLNIIHKDVNGKTYANIQSIMALPRGMAKGSLSDKALVYDIDDDDPSMVNDFPNWIKDLITKSESYQERITKVDFKEILDESDGELPF